MILITIGDGLCHFFGKVSFNFFGWVIGKCGIGNTALLYHFGTATLVSHMRLSLKIKASVDITGLRIPVFAWQL